MGHPAIVFLAYGRQQRVGFSQYSSNPQGQTSISDESLESLLFAVVSENLNKDGYKTNSTFQSPIQGPAFQQPVAHTDSLIRKGQLTPQQVTAREFKKLYGESHHGKNLRFNWDKEEGDQDVLVAHPDAKSKIKVYADGTSAEIEMNPWSRRPYTAMITKSNGEQEAITGNRGELEKFNELVESKANPIGYQNKRAQELSGELNGAEFHRCKQNPNILTAHRKNNEEGIEQTAEVYPGGMSVVITKDESRCPTVFSAVIKRPGKDQEEPLMAESKEDLQALIKEESQQNQ